MWMSRVCGSYTSTPLQTARRRSRKWSSERSSSRRTPAAFEALTQNTTHTVVEGRASGGRAGGDGAAFEFERGALPFGHQRCRHVFSSFVFGCELAHAFTVTVGLRLRELAL